MAGNLRSLAFLTSFSSWAAPSSRLYSECTCRWTNSACCTTGRLLELDGGGGLVRDVVEHGVDETGDREEPRVAALVALHADGANRDDPALRTRGQRDGRGLDGGPSLGAQAPHGQPGAGKRMPPHDVVRQPQLLAEHAHLVLVEVDQRLDDPAGVDQRLDALDTIVVRLDLRGVAGVAGLGRVGIDRPLPEQPVALAQPEARELVLLHRDARP